MRHIFDLNEEVTVYGDIAEYFTGAKGIIRDVTVVGGNTLYGVEITEGPEFDKTYSTDNLLYFLAMELQ